MGLEGRKKIGNAQATEARKGLFGVGLFCCGPPGRVNPIGQYIDLRALPSFCICLRGLQTGPFTKEPDHCFLLARFFSILSSSMSMRLKLQLFQKGGYRNGRRSKRLSSGAVTLLSVFQAFQQVRLCATHSSRCNAVRVSESSSCDLLHYQQTSLSPPLHPSQEGKTYG